MMGTGELTTLARPYAVAIHQCARETGTADRWAEQLDFLAAVVDDARIVQAAANPKTGREAFTAAFLDLCGGYLDGEAENLVRLLILNRRLNLVKPIAELFGQYKAEAEGYVEVEVITAFALEGHEWESLAAVLGRVFRKQARLKVFIDPRLLGGITIRAGDRVIDASVRGQIERLAKRLWN